MSNKVEKIWLISLPFAMLSLLIIGTFLDFEISQSIFRQNNFFSSLFDIIGKMPIFLIGAVAVLFLLKSALVKHNYDTFMKNCYYTVLYLSGIVLSCMAFVDLSSAILFNDKVCSIVLCGVLGLVFFNTIFLMSYKIDPYKFNNYSKWAQYTLVTILLMVASIIVIKSFCNRLGYSEMVMGKGEFSSWYSKLNICLSEHVILACGLFLIVPLGKYNKKIKENLIWIRLIACVYVIMTMLARISGGNQFVSDIAISLMLVYVIINSTNFMFWGIKGEKIALGNQSIKNYI